jgi:hypothetical protein
MRAIQRMAVEPQAAVLPRVVVLKTVTVAWLSMSAILLKHLQAVEQGPLLLK